MTDSYADYLATVRQQEARDRARFVGAETADVVYDMRSGPLFDLSKDAPSPARDTCTHQWGEWTEWHLISETTENRQRICARCVCLEVGVRFQRKSVEAIQ